MTRGTNRKVRSTNGSFTFSIRRISSTEPAFADNSVVEKDKFIELFRHYCPGANIRSEIKVTDVGQKISDSRREYQVRITITESDLHPDLFDKALNELAAELDSRGVDY